MASGRLGAANLAATTNTVLYTVPALTVATVNVRVCNRNSSTVQVRIAITTGGAPATTDWITYDKSIEANGILEETGFVCTAGEVVYVYSSVTNVSVRVHGFEEAA